MSFIRVDPVDANKSLISVSLEFTTAMTKPTNPNTSIAAIGAARRDSPLPSPSSDSQTRWRFQSPKSSSAEIGNEVFQSFLATKNLLIFFPFLGFIFHIIFNEDFQLRSNEKIFFFSFFAEQEKILVSKSITVFFCNLPNYIPKYYKSQNKNKNKIEQKN